MRGRRRSGGCRARGRRRGLLSAGLTSRPDDSVTARAVRSATRNRRQDERGTLAATGARRRVEVTRALGHGLRVLGLISFPREPGRAPAPSASRRSIPAPAPLTLTCHPGIGFVLGPPAHGRRRPRSATSGTHHLDAGRDRRARIRWCPSVPNAVAEGRRTDGFPHCPHLLVDSSYWPDMEEVAASEELGQLARRHGRAAELPVRAVLLLGPRPAVARGPGSVPRRSTASSAAGWPALGKKLLASASGL